MYSKKLTCVKRIEHIFCLDWRFGHNIGKLTSIMNKNIKVALVHDYLIQYGGAEKTLEAICELFPNAPVYTSFYKSENFGEVFKDKKIITPQVLGGLLGKIPALSKFLTFLIPLTFESFDLSEYDIIISDSSSYAKGVLTKPSQLHICYIHTPPRFLYKYSVENTKRNSWYFKPFVSVIDYFLRIWDYNAAQRPDYLVANSNEIKGRIKKFYKRDSTVIYPPVELSKNVASETTNDYYLLLGRLVPYKNFDLIIKAFNKLPNSKLKVIGTGPEEQRLKNMAGSNIEFVGRVDDAKKHELIKNCIGLINPIKDEDFGIVPVEVISHGKPVLVQASAGHLETVKDGKTGMYFESLDVDSIVDSIKVFDKKVRSGVFNPKVLNESVQKFSKENFKKNFYHFVMDKFENKTP